MKDPEFNIARRSIKKKKKKNILLRSSDDYRYL